MASKCIYINGIGQVSLYKRKNCRTIKLSIANDGSIKVTLPHWVPYKAGEAFVQSKAGWIQQHSLSIKNILEDNQKLGREHTLRFITKVGSSQIKTRIKASDAIITFPETYTSTSPQVQKSARTVAIRALRNQAESLIPPRVIDLASQYGFHYRSITIRQLTGRWGSCDQFGNITFNLFLIQLPWELIDYVVKHELTHTKVLNHSSDFWNQLSAIEPNAKKLKAEIKQYRPTILNFVDKSSS